MNLRGVDLNLLTVLDAVIAERHVSRAAARLGMSQPAVSNALDRCRALFGDPLIERHGRGMRLTPRGEELQAPLAELVADIGRLVRPQEEVPLARLRRTVRLMASDALVGIVAPALGAALAREAPGIVAVFRPWRSGADAVEALRDGDAELVLGIADPPPLRNVVATELGEQPMAVLMRQGHPAAEDLTLESWLAWPHLVVSVARSTGFSPIAVSGAMSAWSCRALPRPSTCSPAATSSPCFPAASPSCAANWSRGRRRFPSRRAPSGCSGTGGGWTILR